MTLTYLRNGDTLTLNRAVCARCGMCRDVCPHGVFAIRGDGAQIQRREQCMECGACARNCPTGALGVRAGVGCAAAVLGGLARGRAPGCGGGSACTG